MYRLIFAAFTALFLYGCGGSDDGPDIDSIQLDVSETSIAVGDTAEIQTSLLYTDNSGEVLPSADITWSASPEGLVEINSSSGTSVNAIASGSVSITATYENYSESVDLDIRPAEPREVVLSDNSIELSNGREYQIETSILYSDGSTTSPDNISYSSANESVASVSESGVVIAEAEGETDIEVTANSLTAMLSITVNAAELDSIVLAVEDSSIAEGQQTEVTVSGIYSDETTSDLTSQAELSSGNESVLAVTGNSVQGISTGTASVTGAVNGLEDTKEVEVTPAVVTSLEVTNGDVDIPLGLTETLNVEAYYSDGSVSDVTTQASYMIVDSAIATVDESGVIESLTQGSTTVDVSYNGFSNSVTVVVSDAILESISTSPSDSIEVYKEAQTTATATGHFSDGSTSDISSSVTWSSNDETVLSVSNHSSSPGLITALEPGTATVTAAQNGQESSFSVTVNDVVLTDISITTTQPSAMSLQPGVLSNNIEPTAVDPTVDNLPAGYDLQLFALGTFDNGDTSDITSDVNWQSTDSSVVEFSNPTSSPGVMSGIAPGAADISATLSGVTASQSITVTDAILQSLNISFSSSDFFEEDMRQATVNGSYSDGSEQDLTSQVSWQIADSSVATVSNSNSGLVTAVNAGTTTLTASFDGVQATANITVTANVIEAIDIEASVSSVYVGRSIQYAATATMSNGDTSDITNDGNWAIKSANVGSITNSGLFSANNSGNTQVTFDASTLGFSSVIEKDVEVKSIQSMASSISKSISAAVSIINGVIQPGSQFSYSVTNGTGVNLNLVEFIVQDPDSTVEQTSDSSNLNGGTLANGESHGLTVTIQSSGVTTPLDFRFVFEDPVTGIQFNADYTYK
ncbi:Ig-like protein group 2 [Idiomarina fontislapidosi]|uniref:BIG2 domain-containing protein n=1 Tax=Idiomarina fontislapidosi TaxID=263723 RepID=A0A432XRW9_9GAMM|nr:Ig-like domain-containing protein [Idiomarina fontislapidosi]PYE31148.1 Ig-like protein group 2 [Idiomarina fontislapidosi]RUO51452.1 hypothetical protein CWE25_11000 [Idiomarina fontislapidosi]